MNSEQTFHSIYNELTNIGEMVSPRGIAVLECENYNYVLEPYIRFASFESRKLNLNYIKEEFLWYLRGERYDTSITRHAKMWSGLINEDGSINSNYGQYIFGKEKQFDRALQVLIADKDSRRASISILNKEHLLSNTKDVPCTYSMNFRIRKNRLNMTVRMRSQDAILGMGNDAPAFSFIHEMMLQSLKRAYPELECGNYYHSADSFHLYEKHFGIVTKILQGDKYIEVDCPRISGPDEVDYLRSKQYQETLFEFIPKEYKFAIWLCTKEA